MVKMLLAAGSGTEGANADGQTALMLAIKNGDLPIFQMLIDAGAKVNVVEKVQDQTPLMWAAAATRNAAEMVKVLLAKGANVNARAKFNDWPSQITSEPRAQYHAVWRTDAAAVRRSRRLLRLRRSAGRCGRRCESADAGRRHAR